MSFKKNPTIEELTDEVEALREQVITLNAKLNATNRAFKNHPAVVELSALKNKWWFKLITWSW